ncbi:MAG: hypothetical protein VB133_01615 [Anaeromusa sp.]|uniref:hypothetical protein n=1 Tax=Anaeromusa sp. TaxID=1872520 RepID=UPI002B219C42|nr:hypothetical protein [Anaeromusa sp.]MEA4833825.1 hypothetical protein [Anaeromusa sp.]
MSLEIIGGDISEKYVYTSAFGSCLLSRATGLFKTESIDLAEMMQETILVTEENKSSFIGKAKWGLIGGIALGPIGLLAGVVAGGKKKEICFIGRLKDGREFMAISDIKTYQKLAALALANR